MRLCWEGETFVWSSLALINREVARRLAARRDIAISLYQSAPARLDPRHVPDMADLLPLLAPLPGPADVHVRHQWPFRDDPPPSGRWVVMQHWEFGSLPRPWLAPMRDRIDEIWVASRFVRDCCVASGVPADQVAIIPCGVDTALFTDVGPAFPLATDKRFKFLFVGGTIPRKGVDLLLKAYGLAFQRDDDVTLIVKDFGSRTSYLGQGIGEQLAAMAASDTGPEIRLIDTDLAPAELAALYRSVDCLVQPYRGEGFGLPIAEAMAAGRPVIVPDYGACLDFCDADTAVLVPARVVAHPDRIIGDLETVHHPWWCEVDVHGLAAAMRAMVADPAAFQAMARRGQARIRADFTWDRTVDRIVERLTVLTERPARRLARQQAPFAIAGRRRVAFLMLPDWSHPVWKAGLAAYLQAFGPTDDVSLVLYVPPRGAVSLADVETALVATICALGHDPERIADVIIMHDALGRSDHADLIVATDVYLPCGEALAEAHTEAAHLYGRTVVTAVAAETLRAVAGF